METRVQLRRDTAANWTSANPVLALSEPAWAYDTKVLKVGDGATAYNALPDFAGGAAGAVDSVNTQTGVVVLDADDISIADAGNLYTATNVEAALAEVKGVADSAAGGGISPTGTVEANDFAQFTNGTTVRGRSSSEVISDLNIPNVRRNIVQNTDTGGDQTTPLELVSLNYPIQTNSPDVEQVRINGTVSASRNEWGALRGHSPFSWGDALVRAIVQPGSNINQGNALELQDRTAAGNPVLWGRRWRTGQLIRNNVVMADTYVTNESTTDATINGLGLPNGTVVVQITGA